MELRMAQGGSSFHEGNRGVCGAQENRHRCLKKSERQEELKRPMGRSRHTPANNFYKMHVLGAERKSKKHGITSLAVECG